MMNVDMKRTDRTGIGWCQAFKAKNTNEREVYPYVNILHFGWLFKIRLEKNKNKKVKEDPYILIHINVLMMTLFILNKPYR